jgi:hypothetical protein
VHPGVAIDGGHDHWIELLEAQVAWPAHGARELWVKALGALVHIVEPRRVGCEWAPRGPPSQRRLERGDLFAEDVSSTVVVSPVSVLTHSQEIQAIGTRRLPHG